MAKTDKTKATIDAWESGKLGREEAFAATAEIADEQALDEALGLQMISIRLPKRLIEDLKFIAKHRGIGYQPLIRDNISRFATSEMKLILIEKLERIELEEKHKNVGSKFAMPTKEKKAA